MRLVLVGLWNAVLLAAASVALWRHRLSLRQNAAYIAKAPPPIPYTLVRLCCGEQAYLPATLLSVLHHRGHQPTEVILAAKHNDEVWPTLQQCASQLIASGLPTRCIVTEPLAHMNGKVAQLCQVTPHITTPVVMYSDCDVDLSHFHSEGMLAWLAQPQVALVWAAFCLQPAVASAHWGNRLLQSLLTRSLHSFAVLGHIDPKATVGKLLAIRLAALQHIGGWQTVGSQLGEDMGLGVALRQAGYHTRFYPAQTAHIAGNGCFQMATQRLRRWLSVIYLQRPSLLVSYGLLFAAFWPLMLISWPHLRCCLLTLLVRWLVGVMAARCLSSQPLPSVWAWLPVAWLSDLWLLVVWLSLFYSRKQVVWGDCRYSLKSRQPLQNTKKF